MCYPKPGPRCSAHALTDLIKAKAELNILYEERKNNPKISMNVILKKLASIEKLQEVFYTTPAGIRELEDILVGKDPEDRYSNYYKFKQQLELSQKKRANQLKALKKQQREAGEIAHATHEFKEYANKEFLYETSKAPITDDDERIQSMMNDSINWVNKLSPEEIEAVRWYTKGGYQELRTYKEFNEIDIKGRTSEDLAAFEGHIDNALAKYERDEPIIVYRGHGLKVAERHMDSHTYFKEGDEFQHSSYVSTTLDENVASKFAVSQIIFEIKSKKAVPVVGLSQHGLGERELLIPASQKFKVVKVSRPDMFSNTVVSVIEVD